MKPKDILWGIVEAVLWYAFTAYLLSVVGDSLNVWLDALVLVVLAYLTMLACPWFRHTGGWRRMTGRE
ncbi:MAG: hypothetical protein AAB601_02790 [Patescibacteria group bacterium]